MTLLFCGKQVSFGEGERKKRGKRSGRIRISATVVATTADVNECEIWDPMSLEFSGSFAPYQNVNTKSCPTCCHFYCTRKATTFSSSNDCMSSPLCTPGTGNHLFTFAKRIDDQQPFSTGICLSQICHSDYIFKVLPCLAKMNDMGPNTGWN